MRKSFLTTLLFLTLLGGGVFWFTHEAQGVNRTWDGERQFYGFYKGIFTNIA